MHEDTAMPMMLQPDDFQLNDYTFNKARYAEYVNKKGDILEEGEGVSLIMYGNRGTAGYILGLDHVEEMVYYAIKFKRLNKKVLGETVTQTMLWRSASSPHAIGLTDKIVFDYLLRIWPAILSDQWQTPQGKEFWQTLLARAYKKGRKYGLVDLNQRELHEPKPGESSTAFWNRVVDLAYGDKDKHRAWRFFIKA